MSELVPGWAVETARRIARGPLRGQWRVTGWNRFTGEALEWVLYERPSRGYDLTGAYFSEES